MLGRSGIDRLWIVLGIFVVNKTRIVLFLFLGLTGLCILGSFFGDPVPDETTQETTGEPRKPVKEDGQSVTSAPFKDRERTNTDDELLSYIDRKILADKVRGEKISYESNNVNAIRSYCK